MLERFRLIKIEYKYYLVLFKSGSFYVSFDEDAYILNKLLNYKILNLKNNVKVGFPLNNLDKVKDILNDKNINYLIIDNEIIIYKSKFKYNNFEKYIKGMYSILINKRRIRNINNQLELLLSISDISYKLSKIEAIINE